MMNSGQYRLKSKGLVAWQIHYSRAAKEFLKRSCRESNYVRVCASLSARVSSLRENRLGGWYAYRASKAALNMLMRTAAVELAKDQPMMMCVLLHPGTVDTALSRPFNRNGARVHVFPALSCDVTKNALRRSPNSACQDVVHATSKRDVPHGRHWPLEGGG